MIEEIVLWVDDLACSVRFYRDELGLTLIVDRPGWKVFDTGPTRLCLRARAEVYAPEIERRGSVSGHPGAEIVFRVESLQEQHAALEARGLTFELQPRDYPFGRVASLRDPDGYSVTFFEAPEEEDN